MPQITVRSAEGPAVTYRFEQDTIAIGRAEANDLSLLNATLSRRHAEIRRDGSGWVLADLASRNGTYLNGRRATQPQPLRAGDEIGVGDVVLVFDPPGTPSSARKRDTTKVFQVTASPESEPELIGQSPHVQAIRATIEKTAASQATVLITGESGTGKELVARLIHHRSPRRRGPYVIVNCPALPGSLVESELFGVERGVATGVEARPGKLELADGGTLLLDEVGDLDPAAQAKLLRFLAEKTVERVGSRRPLTVDVRLLAATNHDLRAAVARGAFRGDLFHRLNVVTIELLPLRQRREDVPLLVARFLAATGKSVSAEALALLEAHDYPGNVRELQHVLERASLMSDGAVIGVDDLPAAVRTGVPLVGESTLGRGEATVALLRGRIVLGGESFWDVVQAPFLRRELDREVVRDLIAGAYEESGRSYKGVAALFGIPGQHKKLLDFLRNHELRIKR